VIQVKEHRIAFLVAIAATATEVDNVPAQVALEAFEQSGSQQPSNAVGEWRTLPAGENRNRCVSGIATPSASE